MERGHRDADSSPLTSPKYLDAPAADASTLKVPHPPWSLDGGVAGTRKGPLNEGASFIFGAGQERAPSVVSENAPQGTLP